MPSLSPAWRCLLTRAFPVSLPSTRLTSPSCGRGRCSSQSGTTIALAETHSWGRRRFRWTPGTSRATWRSFCPCMARCWPCHPRPAACSSLPCLSLSRGVALRGQRGAETLAESCHKACPKSHLGETKTPEQTAVVVKKCRSALSLASLLLLSISPVGCSAMALSRQVFSFCLLVCSKSAALPSSLPRPGGIAANFRETDGGNWPGNPALGCGARQ